MRPIFVILFFGTLLLATPARLQTINYEAMEQEGYSSVVEILRQMSPEQQAGVLRDAAAIRGALVRMSPDEKRRVISEMDRVYLNTDFTKVKPEAYHPQKHHSKSLPLLRQDLRRAVR
jgi:hypothetical protein